MKPDRETLEAGQVALQLDPNLLPPAGAHVRFEGVEDEPVEGVIEVLRALKGRWVSGSRRAPWTGDISVQLQGQAGFVSRRGELVTILRLPDPCPPIHKWPRRSPRLNVNLVLAGLRST